MKKCNRSLFNIIHINIPSEFILVIKEMELKDTNKLYYMIKKEDLKRNEETIEIFILNKIGDCVQNFPITNTIMFEKDKLIEVV